MDGQHGHDFLGGFGDTGDPGDIILTDDTDSYGINTSAISEFTAGKGEHSHKIKRGGDTETNPVNRAYQLYTIVDN